MSFEDKEAAANGGDEYAMSELAIRTVTLKNMTKGYIVAHADKNGKIFI